MYVGKILMLSDALYGAQKLPSEPTDRMGASGGRPGNVFADGRACRPGGAGHALASSSSPLPGGQ